MKNAILLFGHAAYNRENRIKSTQVLDLIFEETLNSFKNRIVTNETDIYIHTWQNNYSDKYINYIKPKKYLIEEQKPFKVNQKMRNTRDLQSIYARLYSFRILKQFIENETYNFVFLTRPDLKYFKPLNWLNLNLEKIYLAKHEHNNIYNTSELIDYFILGSHSNMMKFLDIESVLNHYIDNNLFTYKHNMHCLFRIHLDQLGLINNIDWLCNYPSDIAILRHAYDGSYNKKHAQSVIDRNEIK